MSYKSIDVLQKIFAKDVFYYTKSPKKASGRAIGTLVEIINFYLLKAWGYGDSTVIERSIPEYGNNNITHNVEFSLHPKIKHQEIILNDTDLPFTAKKIIKQINIPPNINNIKSNQLLSTKGLMRNACIIYEDNKNISVASLGNKRENKWIVSVNHLYKKPYAVFECKRVGVEEGVKKGPQTIEKAKQGAYVARSISSLQKIRMSDGSVFGVLQLPDGKIIHEPYHHFLKKIIKSNDPSLSKDFILTVGIVSNHGNWFTSRDHNKELRVLAQSYDWLLFLTDDGLSKFIEELLLNPVKRYQYIKKAFIDSYHRHKTGNHFTKVKISLEVGRAIQSYFNENLLGIERWFNIIAPVHQNIKHLKKELAVLSSKKWGRILQ